MNTVIANERSCIMSHKSLSSSHLLGENIFHLNVLNHSNLMSNTDRRAYFDVIECVFTDLKLVIHTVAISILHLLPD